VVLIWSAMIPVATFVSSNRAVALEDAEIVGSL
jgi:hypothetical protein